MKLVIAMVLFLNFQSFAKGFGQTKITLSLKSIELKQALLIIEKQSSYHFLFSDRKIETDKKVDVFARNEEVLTVLTRLLNSAGYTYAVLENNLVVITPEADGGYYTDVKGTVKDAKGAVLPAVSVQIKGKKGAVVTDTEGKYHISAVEGDSLVFSAVGYQKQTIAVDKSATIDITLEVDSKDLDGVIVTSMGIKKEVRSLGYAVSTVTSKDLTQTGSTNFAAALYGKAAGVKIIAAPGGASSAVSVQVRGISSVNGTTQPLYVVDGVPIRNYNNLTTGSFGTTDGRIDGNGALDINPEDIETLTVLKGASASALYGSEATNGVVVITTKKGNKNRGLGVDVNYIFNKENLGLSPDYQNEYGPGYDAQTNVANGISDADGWITEANGAVHPYYRSYAQFGPKFDGRNVEYWDGTTRKYVANKNNYRDFYQNGYNSTVNAAVSNASENGNYRISYTRLDYKGILPGTKLYKNNFNFNGTLKLSPDVSIDLVSQYNNTFTHNRAYAMSNIFGSYTGFISRMDDMNAYFDHYQTTNGYKYVMYNNTNYDQDQKLALNMRATNLLDYLYTALRDNYDETQNRFINSATLNIKLPAGFRFRGRVGGDFTSWRATTENHNTEPTAVGYTGAYALEQRSNNSFYGDLLLIYNKKVTKDLDLTATAGYTARKQTYTYQKSSTANGLVDENWFSLSNSAGTLTTSAARASQLDRAAFGVINLNYKNFLYMETTGRAEATSTLPAAVNSYFYPSVNAGFVFSDVFNLPSFWNYGKLRSSYGLVGNHPMIYQANVGYTQNTVAYSGSSVLYQQSAGSNFGNGNIKSEQKREFEIGVENKLFNNKIGLDLTYYNSLINKMILYTSTAPSSGSTSALVNAGSMRNYGFEAAISATPLQTKSFKWNTRFNLAVNRNKLLSLTPGLSNLTTDIEGGGYVIMRSEIGSALGNIYVHPMTEDGNGNKVVNSSGLYTANTSAYKYVGNVMPKFVGGFSNTFSYKNFALDVTMDYRFGGKLVSIPSYYQLGAGMFKSTLQYRDAAHGGISYNVVNDTSATYVASSTGTRHDGVILKGVTTDGAKNQKVITAAMYYQNTFNWRTDGDYSAAVLDNSYIKLREVAITYSISKKVTDKLHLQGLQLAIIGRNLLYLYKTLPYGLDPEVATGSGWQSQGQDNGTAGPTRSMGVSIRARF